MHGGNARRRVAAADLVRCCTALLLALLVAAGATGCRQRSGTTVNIGGTATPNTPGEALWLGFKARTEAASGGRIRMRALIYGQLGSEEQLLSGLRRGRIQYANLSAQVLSTVVPELAVLQAPFLFDSAAEADFVYDRYLTGFYRRLLAEKGIHLVTWYEIGFHDVYGIEPILTPGDARGRRFRIASSLNARLFAEAIGADPVLLGFGEIVPSLQTGLIEAGENSVSLYARTGIAGEAPHLTLTHHLLGVSLIVAPSTWWQALTAEERRILTESFPAVEESRRVVREQGAAELGEAQALGFVVHPLDAVSREAWRQATAGVTRALIDEIGGRAQEAHDLIVRAKVEYAETGGLNRGQ
ncbi:MAG: TRAP transporter substrate-binding protein [Gammaproteobacteria bacterium]|nr:TRAP transporter substrate-binding protein [Gammaproteobacteria bacterium]